LECLLLILLIFNFFPLIRKPLGAELGKFSRPW
jgi:hypothetical protein